MYTSQKTLRVVMFNAYEDTNQGKKTHLIIVYLKRRNNLLIAEQIFTLIKKCLTLNIFPKYTMT